MDFSRPTGIHRSYSTQAPKKQYENFRKDATEYPMMLVIATVYPCNFGCPNCPYSEDNSSLRKTYSDLGGDYFPVELWNKIAIESGPYGSWLRCTGGGEPMMHPKMVDMILFAKKLGCRIWLNSNGSLFGPNANRRKSLEKLISEKIDIIEFSMDASDAETYSLVRPPLKGSSLNKFVRWENQVSNVKAALEFRKKFKSGTRIVISVIRQEIVADKLDEIISFWMKLGVDEVITRKFLNWDDNTTIDLSKSADKNLYKIENLINKEPCVWPFERLNIDTLGRIALCGQDISFRTSKLFPTLHEASVKEIWLGETFTKYRKYHLEGKGGELDPCGSCSAWKAGVRSWDHGWIKVLRNSAAHVEEIMKNDVGAEVEIHTPNA